VSTHETSRKIKTRNSSADEIGERYCPIHAVIVKLYHPYNQFPRYVSLSHQRIATFSAHRDFLLLRLINTLT